MIVSIIKTLLSTKLWEHVVMRWKGTRSKGLFTKTRHSLHICVDVSWYYSWVIAMLASVCQMGRCPLQLWMLMVPLVYLSTINEISNSLPSLLAEFLGPTLEGGSSVRWWFCCVDAFLWRGGSLMELHAPLEKNFSSRVTLLRALSNNPGIGGFFNLVNLIKWYSALLFILVDTSITDAKRFNKVLHFSSALCGLRRNLWWSSYFLRYILRDTP